ncbi:MULTISPECIES: hypothetical protein [unclassified Streptomyces]|nr:MULTISPECIES: hypothetical protein [unclassified Streptomyces]
MLEALIAAVVAILLADGAEKTKLKQVAASCPNAKVTWKVAR